MSGRIPVNTTVNGIQEKYGHFIQALEEKGEEPEFGKIISLQKDARDRVFFCPIRSQTGRVHEAPIR